MNKESAAQSGEERLIARYFAPLAKHPGALGLSDDAAAITPPAGCDLVLKTDGIVAGVHFFLDDPPELVAKKALRVNLSDLAAKGATPIGFLLTLALPEEIGDAWLAPFARGLGADAQAFGCPLLGGDTDRTGGPITISIAAVGAVPHGKMVRRAGAKAGERGVADRAGDHHALGTYPRAARPPRSPLSRAGAAHRYCRNSPRARFGGHGRLRRPRGRSWQALPRLRRRRRNRSSARSALQRRARRARQGARADRNDPYRR